MSPLQGLGGGDSTPYVAAGRIYRISRIQFTPALMRIAFSRRSMLVAHQGCALRDQGFRRQPEGRGMKKAALRLERRYIPNRVRTYFFFPNFFAAGAAASAFHWP